VKREGGGDGRRAGCGRGLLERDETLAALEVLALLAGGLRNAQIAERLVVSQKTVDHHVSAILRKLDVRTRAQAARKATRLGLTA
jgi:DNA-binding NarL/FixJ family response regulator